MRQEVRVPGRFIALEGPDGVGKTALARCLGEITYETVIEAADHGLPSGNGSANCRPLVFAPKRQISGTSAYAAKLMTHLATMLWHSGDEPDLPDSFWVGLQAAWFTAHAETVLQPLLSAGYDVIVDGWLYKFWSKLLIQGYTQRDLDIIFARVRMPDAVVLLTADISSLFDRRRFRPAELGMHAGYSTLDRQSFVDYQQAGLGLLRSFAEQHQWPVVDLDLECSAEHTAARIAPLITALRTAAPCPLPMFAADRRPAS
jgi:thymidylate kinase